MTTPWDGLHFPTLELKTKYSIITVIICNLRNLSNVTGHGHYKLYQHERIYSKYYNTLHVQIRQCHERFE